LFYNKSPKAMIKNRFKRIFLPFIVFLIFLYPLLTFALKYCKAIFNDDIPISIEQHFTSPFSYIPLILFHLWFLFHLFLAPWRPDFAYENRRGNINHCRRSACQPGARLVALLVVLVGVSAGRAPHDCRAASKPASHFAFPERFRLLHRLGEI
jgi:hypothetical protein